MNRIVKMSANELFNNFMDINEPSNEILNIYKTKLEKCKRDFEKVTRDFDRLVCYCKHRMNECLPL